MDSKWPIDKFSKENDFKLWKVNMQVIISLKRCIKALKHETLMPTCLTQVEKTEMMDKAIRVIILCLEDKVLRNAVREKTVTSMWEKFKLLFMTKYLTPGLCLKQQLYLF